MKSYFYFPDGNYFSIDKLSVIPSKGGIIKLTRIERADFKNGKTGESLTLEDAMKYYYPNVWKVGDYSITPMNDGFSYAHISLTQKKETREDLSVLYCLNQLFNSVIGKFKS